MFHDYSCDIDPGNGSEKLWNHTKNFLLEKAIKHPAGLSQIICMSSFLWRVTNRQAHHYSMIGYAWIYLKLGAWTMRHSKFFFGFYDFIMIESFFWVKGERRPCASGIFIHVTSFWNFWHCWLGDKLMQPSRSLVIAALGPVIHVAQHYASVHHCPRTCS